MDFSFLEKINNNGSYLTTKKRLKAIFADANQMKVWFTRHPRHRRFKPEPPIIKVVWWLLCFIVGIGWFIWVYTLYPRKKIWKKPLKILITSSHSR